MTVYDFTQVTDDADERAARYSDLFGGPRDRVPDCAYCAVCSTIAVVRRTRPELVDHLAVAARELLAAASLLIEEAAKVVPPPGSARSGDEPRVRGVDAR